MNSVFVDVALSLSKVSFPHSVQSDYAFLTGILCDSVLGASH